MDYPSSDNCLKGNVMCSITPWFDACLICVNLSHSLELESFSSECKTFKIRRLTFIFVVHCLAKLKAKLKSFTLARKMTLLGLSRSFRFSFHPCAFYSAL